MPTLHALLLTDVVDSTRLTEELGDAAMAALWTAHDRVARDLLPTWRGREIDKTDGMLLLFDDVTDAVGYALAYHRALAARGLPFKARAGIHVGLVSLRPNPPEDVARGAKPVEVDGLALPIAARVMSVALGAQTLLSADARLALGVVPQRVVSHGHWRMHGVADPVELFEVGDIGEGSVAPFKAPPDGAKVYRVMRQGELWQPVREVRHSVPAERDSFVGRQEPLQVLAKKFDDGARLVSVLGMGGTGKTRLVTRFAWTVLGDYPGGVWFCDLSQARTVDGIHFAVAQGLDVSLGKTDPVVQLAHAIAGRGRCLVILDNFEQVARFAEETLGRWLDRAPLAQFIATTREVLGIVGEETLALAPLAIPDAAALFLRRAASARQGYSPSADDCIAIDQLVRVLDGLPLAIELAAARIRVLSVPMLLSRMSERFAVLRSLGGRLDRQSTLQAAFDWSWELLPDLERVVLAKLSVFEGSFSLETAAAVLTLPNDDSHPQVNHAQIDYVVQCLADKSLLRPLSSGRFDLLESLREYVAEQLRSAGRFRDSGPLTLAATQRLHWRYFAQLGEAGATADRCVEASNLVAACRRAITAGDALSAVGCLMGAWAALRLTGPFRVCADLGTTVAGLSGLGGAALAKVHWVIGSALDACGEVATSRAHLFQGLAALSTDQDSQIRCRLLLTLGTRQTTDEEHGDAAVSLEEARKLASTIGDIALEAYVLNALGRLDDHQSFAESACGLYEAALDLARRAADQRLEGGVLGNLAGLDHDAGRLQKSHTRYRRALELAVWVGDRRWEGNARCNLGLLLLDLGKSLEAFEQFDLALRISRETGSIRLEYFVLCNSGIALQDQGQLNEALEQFELAVAVAGNSGDHRSVALFKGYLAVCYASGGRIPIARECLRSAEVLMDSNPDRLARTLFLIQRADVDIAENKLSDASDLLQRASTAADDLAAGDLSGLRRKLTASLHALHARRSADL